MGRTNAGIWGVGVFLPPEVRGNDWWPPETVALWRRVASLMAHIDPADAPPTEGGRRTLAAMASYAADPFMGSVKRHVMPPGMKTSDMEIAAARRALEAASVAPAELDFILSYTAYPEVLNAMPTCLVHKALGAPSRCFTLSVDAACNSFLAQLHLASGLVAGGARAGLLLQTCYTEPYIPSREPVSAWFGAASTAVVVGPVAEGRGVLGRAHRTDGNYFDALVLGNPAGGHFCDAPARLFSPDPKVARRMILRVADNAREVLDEALDEALARPEEVDFFAGHQATAWMLDVTRDHCGLARARSVETFSRTANVSASNLPLQLHLGRESGALRDGDLVAMYAGGSGITFSAIVLRWGR